MVFERAQTTPRKDYYCILATAPNDCNRVVLVQVVYEANCQCERGTIDNYLFVGTVLTVLVNGERLHETATNRAERRNTPSWLTKQTIDNCLHDDNLIS